MWVVHQSEDGEAYDYTISGIGTVPHERQIVYELKLNISEPNGPFFLIKSDERPDETPFAWATIPKSGWRRSWQEMEIGEHQTAYCHDQQQRVKTTITFTGTSYEFRTEEDGRAGDLLVLEYEALHMLEEILQENGLEYGFMVCSHQAQPLDQTLLAPRR